MKQREYRQRQVQLKSYGGSLEEQLIKASQERQLTRAEKATLAKEQKRRKQNERTRNYRMRKAAEIPKKRKLKKQQEFEGSEGSSHTLENDNLNYPMKRENGVPPPEGANAAQIWHKCPRCSFWFDCLSEPSYTERPEECPPEISELTPLTERSYTERPGECQPQPDTISPPTVNGEYSSNMTEHGYAERHYYGSPAQPEAISALPVNEDISFVMNKGVFSGEVKPNVNKQTDITISIPTALPMQRNDTTESQQELGVVVTPQIVSRNYNTDSSSIIESAQSLTSTVIVKTEPGESNISGPPEEISTPSIEDFSSAIPIFQSSTESIVNVDNTIKQEPLSLALPDDIGTPDTVETGSNGMDYNHYVKGVSVDKALLSRFRNPTKLPVLTKELGELMLFLKPRVLNTVESKRSQLQGGVTARKTKQVVKNPSRINKTKTKSGLVKKRTKSKVKPQKTKVNNSEYKLKVLPIDLGDGSVTLTQEHKIQADTHHASEQFVGLYSNDVLPKQLHETETEAEAHQAIEQSVGLCNNVLPQTQTYQTSDSSEELYNTIQPDM